MSELLDLRHINAMNEQQLRQELIRALEQHLALCEAFESLPEVPRWQALSALADYHYTWPRHWEMGKALQRTHGSDVVPPKTEYEAAAGLWSTIRQALLDFRKSHDT